MKLATIIFLFCLISLKPLSAAEKPDTLKTKTKDDYYLQLDDKIILSASHLILDRSLTYNKLQSGEGNPIQLGSQNSGGVYSLQYAKMKFTYSRLYTRSTGDKVKVNTNGNTLAFSYGFSKWYFAFKYESYFRDTRTGINNTDLSSLHFAEPSLTVRYSPFKTYYANQLTSANYIQKKTRGTIYIETTPYQRTFLSSDTLILLQDIGTWPELADANKITQRGAIIKIGLEGNLVIKKIFYLAASVQAGINPCSSNKLSFAGTKTSWSAADFIYSYSFGAGFNFKFPLFLKFSYDQDVVNYSAPTYKIIDSRKTIYFTLGYRFNEPGFLKRTREKIVAKTKSIFK